MTDKGDFTKGETQQVSADRRALGSRAWWNAFAKEMGARLVRIEGGCCCLEWKPPKGSYDGDSAWFSPNMVDRIRKARA